MENSSSDEHDCQDDGNDIREIIRHQFEEEEKEEQRKQKVYALFQDKKEKEEYGFDDRVLGYMRKTIKLYRKELRIKNQQLRKEADLINVDDTWLKVSKLMYEPMRFKMQNERLKMYLDSDPDKYVDVCLSHILKKKSIIQKAGEMLCAYLDIDPQAFMFSRYNGEPTIIETLDPIQFLIPNPKQVNVIDKLSKDKTIAILKEILQITCQKIKDNKESLKVRKQHLQPLYHYLIEDMLWMEFEFDFEDFKQTIMFHEILNDEKLVKEIDELDQELHTSLAELFIDSD